MGLKDFMKKAWDEAKEDYKAYDEKRKEEKAKKEERKAYLYDKYIGEKGFKKEVFFDLYYETFEHFEQFLNEDETPLKAIEVEYDVKRNMEVDGVLLATDQRLIFALKKKQEFLYDELEYHKMKGVQQAYDDSFGKREIYIMYGRSKRKFDDVNKHDLKEMLTVLEEQIMRAQKEKKRTAPKRKQSTESDKYQQLEKIGQLRDQGILSDEEFEEEKQKILKG